jgi:hypothetical protein
VDKSCTRATVMTILHGKNKIILFIISVIYENQTDAPRVELLISVGNTNAVIMEMNKRCLIIGASVGNYDQDITCLCTVHLVLKVCTTDIPVSF